jgi:predicted nucleic acid-binding protein
VSRLCLDTSAYSHFKRGHEAVVALVDAAEWVGVPAIVLGELRTGFALGGRAEANERELGGFLKNASVEVLLVDDTCSRIYADIVVALRKAGTPLPTNDIWIAATAVRDGATVVTYDSHFRAIQRVGAIVLSTSS